MLWKYRYRLRQGKTFVVEMPGLYVSRAVHLPITELYNSSGCTCIIRPRRNHSRALKQGITSLRLYTYSVLTFMPFPDVRALTCTAPLARISFRFKCRSRTYSG